VARKGVLSQQTVSNLIATKSRMTSTYEKRARSGKRGGSGGKQRGGGGGRITGEAFLSPCYKSASTVAERNHKKWYWSVWVASNRERYEKGSTLLLVKNVKKERKRGAQRRKKGWGANLKGAPTTTAKREGRK